MNAQPGPVSNPNPAPDSGLTRRDFVRTAAVAGAGLMTGMHAWAEEPAGSEAEVAIAMIGPGSQGRNLLTKCLKIPGIRFVAVCDVWEYHQTYSANILKKYDQNVNVYADFRDMLAKEKNLDAVVIATPDWVHAEQTNECLRAGKHVYCEKEMANTIEACKSMVDTARETKKLLQIGHQRRSNPRYWHAKKLMEKDKVLGRITHVQGQWNRARLEEQGWPENQVISADLLKQFGYENMDEFRNWRWYRKFSGGPMADLGSHQLDVFNWFLNKMPKRVLASGGLDYYTEQAGRDWYDNVLTIYEWEVDGKPVRGTYQVLNTTSHGGFFETFMGDEGSLVVSEDPRKGHFFREQHAKRREWEDQSETVANMDREAIELKIGETLAPDGSKDATGQALLEESKKPVHQLHLENFFNAIRTGSPLSCPPEIAYETAIAVLRVNDAIAAGGQYTFDPAEFKA